MPSHTSLTDMGKTRCFRPHISPFALRGSDPISPSEESGCSYWNEKHAGASPSVSTPPWARVLRASCCRTGSDATICSGCGEMGVHEPPSFAYGKQQVVRLPVRSRLGWDLRCPNDAHAPRQCWAVARGIGHWADSHGASKAALPSRASHADRSSPSCRSGYVVRPMNDTDSC